MMSNILLCQGQHKKAAFTYLKCDNHGVGYIMRGGGITSGACPRIHKGGGPKI